MENKKTNTDATKAVVAKSSKHYGNRNALRNGRFSFFTTGKLPNGCSYVTRLLNQFRSALEDIIEQRDGDVDLFSSALIQTACRHEARAILAQRWLRDRQDTLTTEQLISISKEIGTASDSRDKALKALRLDRSDTVDLFAVIYGKSDNGHPVVNESPQQAPKALREEKNEIEPTAQIGQDTRPPFQSAEETADVQVLCGSAGNGHIR